MLRSAIPNGRCRVAAYDANELPALYTALLIWSRGSEAPAQLSRPFVFSVDYQFPIFSSINGRVVGAPVDVFPSNATHFNKFVQCASKFI
jgi:hypothetical protein